MCSSTSASKVGHTDLVSSEFGPHSQGHAALTYSIAHHFRTTLYSLLIETEVPFVETTRKIVRAAKLAELPYFIMVGGAGSLELPQIEPYLCAGESGYFWKAVSKPGSLSPQCCLK